jgi:hypothetical protein
VIELVESNMFGAVKIDLTNNQAANGFADKKIG